ncbi:efflux RND transporter periplasmic adaptor subunit [Paenibacillus ginsengarvi]|uniref:HlyD family efflux transporter periplasmic adaptor subunit n=1 Tax=Paenibacillus ginsengarvi TaxID=400777 RepID=A0A3B0CJI1_9BACL|nr:HlyD family efflux transporter periplasmic adaptor subunit [Paenibacillus ginsengarvi]RKN84429.1 HlyD family efflux transporter periplasmic adaptor subunit [Paenibacillus ginsengarvi]
MRHKRLFGTIFVLFFIALAVLTLFSNTIESAMLAKVTTEKPAKKSLSRIVSGSGTLAPRKQTDLLSESSWKIKTQHVGKNDRVHKGDPLVTFDTSEAERQLRDEEARFAKMALSREALQEAYIAAQKADNPEAIRKAKRDLKSDRLDTEIAQRKLDGLRSELNEKRTLVAPFDAAVAELKGSEGANVPSGQAVLTLISSDEGYLFSFVADAEAAALLSVNEPVLVALTGDGPKSAEGLVEEIKDGPSRGGDSPVSGATKQDDKPARAQKTIVVRVSGDGLKGGEQASVKISKPVKQQGLVIRKELLRTDGTDRYVFVVRERKSSLGNAYYVQKAKLTIGEETEEGVIVLSGLAANDEIIAETSAPVKEGNRVRVL